MFAQRKQNRRLREVLARLAAMGAPAWIPPPGEREQQLRIRAGGSRASWSDDLLAVMEHQAVSVVAEQMDVPPQVVRRYMPVEQIFYLKGQRLDLGDQLLAHLSEEEVHELAEQSALANEAAVSQEEIAEAYDIEPKIYSDRWTRVSDEVFQQYGNLEDRRPA